jgi:sulfur-carrier protein
MPTVFIPSLLRKFTGGQESLVVPGRTVGEVVRNLDQQFPGFRNQVVEGDDLKSSLAVSVDGDMAVGGLLEQVRESSEIHFVPAIGGG